MFIDEVRVHVRGGDGGDGVTSFARQPFEPRGRPEGGEGGAGGSVVVRASGDVATLVEYHHRPHRKAEKGRNGSGDLRVGATGDDEVLLVPPGTVVLDDDGRVLADLLAAGDELVVARGGRGGRGNAAFRTSNRKAPGFHERGEPGQEHSIRLELKLLADVALVGFPSAGKSSLVARLSAARPKIADYPFTTLTPNLGVLTYDDVDVVLADVPGLIEGAASGRGLGRSFLRHVERARVLVHVLDCASHEQRDPREDLGVVLAELRQYEDEIMEATGSPLLSRPALVALNKIDADPEVAEIVRPDLEATGFEVLEVSAVSGAGLEELRQRLVALVTTARAEEDAGPGAGGGGPAGARVVLRPALPERPIRVARAEGGWRVTGEQPERWVTMTTLDNDEAVKHLQDRLVAAGVQKRLIAAGARRGEDVEIAGRVFTFDPEPGSLPAGHPDLPKDEDPP